MQDFRYVGLNILNILNGNRVHSEMFGDVHSHFFVFYPNWRIIREFYVSLHKIGCGLAIETSFIALALALSLHKIGCGSAFETSHGAQYTFINIST